MLRCPPRGQSRGPSMVDFASKCIVASTASPFAVTLPLWKERKNKNITLECTVRVQEYGLWRHGLIHRFIHHLTRPANDNASSASSSAFTSKPIHWLFHSAARPYCPLASFCHAGCVGFRCCLVVLWSKMLFRLWPKSLQASKQQLNAHSSALGGPDTEPITGCFSSLWPQLVSRSIGKSRQQSGHRPERRSSLCRLLSYKVNRFTRYARRLHTLSSWLTSASALVARDRCVRRP